VASSSDAKLIQTNNLALTRQPMTAALIFWRQLSADRDRTPGRAQKRKNCSDPGGVTTRPKPRERKDLTHLW
jgi:hypothetical protein